MKKWRCGLVLLFVLMVPTEVWAAEQVEAELADFPVTLNGQTVDSAHRLYPLLLYKGMTYFPLRYEESRYLGLETSWPAEAGLGVERTGVVNVWKDDDWVVNSNPLLVQTADYPVTIDGRQAALGQYPFLDYHGVTYVPLTEDCYRAFGWTHSFDEQKG